ncbi:MAG TPA: NAD(P)/FAD-dependent oxidoreductase [Nitrososphaeraceae archaeon]|nr:NAD(P)/FAD-dependent oxidoreductase [Nitrososphaeraceae archaeon]
MEKKFDSVVVGGSISGLLCAREISRSGLSVAVLEEDYEIGSPEHCGGLVSLDGLKKLGIIPSSRTILNEVNKAKIFSATKGFEVSTSRDNIIVLDRRELDKQVAYQAQKFGSEIRTKSLVTSINYDSFKKEYIIKTKDDIFYSEFFIDARGISSLINNSNREGVLQSAQYEIYADWIIPDEIIVKFDKLKYPDFFAWIIPSGNGKGKIGVAGRKINTLKTLESFIESFSSRYSIIRKIYAPIWIGGPLKNFVFNNMILVGDAAGQTKPTTAGGIFSCGMGGILAGTHLVHYKKNTINSSLNDYETDWYLIFGKEFQKMLLFRRIMERLDNKSIDSIFSLISDSDIAEISKSATFDFHSFALSKILGSKKAIKLITALLGNEFRHILN